MNFRELKKYRTQLLHHANLLNEEVLNDRNYRENKDIIPENLQIGYIGKVIFGMMVVKEKWLEEANHLTSKKEKMKLLKNANDLDKIKDEILKVTTQIKRMKGR